MASATFFFFNILLFEKLHYDSRHNSGPLCGELFHGLFCVFPLWLIRLSCNLCVTL